MPPTLRSSPTKPASAQTTPTSTPTRKTPTCSQCGRPRRGHPRSECPYKDDNTIEHAMTSLKISTMKDAAWELEDTKTAVRQRRRQSQVVAQPLQPSESISSLATSDSNVLNALVTNIETESESEEEQVKEKKIVHWQTMITNKLSKPRKSKQVMPGTLITPSPASSQASMSSTSSLPPPIITYYPISQFSSQNSVDKSDSLPTPTPKAKPLLRTMTMSDVQRNSFMDTLNSRYARTTAYLLPKDDITEIESAALKHGYHTRRVTSVETEEQEQVLVVGQDPVDTQRFWAQINGAAKQKASEGRASGFKQAAGGVVIGAVGAVTALAYV